MGPVPAKFRFLLATARKYGVDDLWVTQLSERYVNRLGERDLTRLSDAYVQLRDSGVFPELVEWLLSIPALGPRGRFKGPSGKIWRMMLLFELLARKDVAPFNAREVGFGPLDDKPGVPADWSGMPKEFSYLIAPAEKFGIYQMDNEVDDFLARVSNEDIDELKQVWAKIVESGHQEARKQLTVGCVKG